MGLKEPTATITGPTQLTTRVGDGIGSENETRLTLTKTVQNQYKFMKNNKNINKE